MISLNVVLAVIFIHWVADFVIQTKWEGENKSKNNKALVSHTFKYSFLWGIFGVVFLAHNLQYDVWDLFIFLGVTFVAHTITDYFTSRLNTKLWNEKRVHDFFVSVGFDQVLHYFQLLLTIFLLTK